MSKVKVRERISDKTVYYPNKELVPLVGFDKKQDFYEIEIEETPVIDIRTHKLKRIETYSNKKGKVYKKWIVSFEVKQLSNEEITNNLNEVISKITILTKLRINTL